jgi:hypothetical protein
MKQKERQNLIEQTESVILVQACFRRILGKRRFLRFRYERDVELQCITMQKLRRGNVSRHQTRRHKQKLSKIGWFLEQSLLEIDSRSLNSEVTAMTQMENLAKIYMELSGSRVPLSFCPSFFSAGTKNRSEDLDQMWGAAFWMHSALRLYMMTDKKHSDAAVQKAIENQSKEEERHREEIDNGAEEWLEGYDLNEGMISYTGKRSGIVVYTHPVNHVITTGKSVLATVICLQSNFRKRQATLKAQRMAWLKMEIPEYDEMNKVFSKLFVQSFFYYDTKQKSLHWKKPDKFCAGGIPTLEIMNHATSLLKLEMLKVSNRDPKKTENDAIWARVQKAKERRSAAATSETKEVQIREAAAQEHWVEVYDSYHEAFYYWHSGTNETTWEKPSAYVMASDDQLMFVTIKLQSVFRGLWILLLTILFILSYVNPSC